MKSFRTASLADQVFDKLEDDIVYGVYKRGEILTELKLAENLGVSRTPIREALRRLEQERLIEDTGKGSVVLGITKDDLLDIMDIRQSIEGLAAFYATINITQEGKEELVRYCKICGEREVLDTRTIAPTGLDDEPNTGDFTPVLAMFAIVVMMVPCLLVKKFRAVK